MKFLSPSRHPIDLGADACADSAHKTLTALTGAAYLHLSHRAPIGFGEGAKEALALFASTSPSYLILQSLDALNAFLSQEYPQMLSTFVQAAEQKKEHLKACGWYFYGNEPLKWTLCAKRYGYTGQELAEILAQRNIVCEFSDPDYLVLMLAPALGLEGLEKICEALCAIPALPALSERAPLPVSRTAELSIRDAMLSATETLPIEQSLGRILASPSVSCPPAVPILMCGERIDNIALEAFAYYGIKHCTVVKNGAV